MRLFWQENQSLVRVACGLRFRIHECCIADVPWEAVKPPEIKEKRSPFDFSWRHFSSRVCVAFATSLKSRQLCMSLLRTLNSKPLHASDLEPYTSFQPLCIPGRILSLRWTSAEWQPCRWAVLEWVSAFDGNLTVAVSFGNAGSCNSQPCMLWLPIRVQVIDTARVFSTSCTWHGNPGLQAGKSQATAPQPQAPRFLLVPMKPCNFVFLAKLQKPQSLKLATPLPSASLASRGPNASSSSFFPLGLPAR